MGVTFSSSSFTVVLDATPRGSSMMEAFCRGGSVSDDFVAGEGAAAATSYDTALGRQPRQRAAYCCSGDAVLAYEGGLAGQCFARADVALRKCLRQDGIHL